MSARPSPATRREPIVLIEEQPRGRQLIKITPLIDVVFILLLFFMLTSSFSRMKQIEVKTSASASPSAQPIPQEVTRLLLESRDRVQLDGVAYPLDSAAFQGALERLAEQEATLIVAATPQVEVQQLIALLDRSRGAGIDRVNLAPSVNPQR